MNTLREKKEEEQLVTPEGATPAKPRTTAKGDSAAATKTVAGDGKKHASTGAAARVPRLLIGVLNGSFLTREKVLGNMPFILFCAGLMIIYIAYGYHTERIVRALDHTDEELKELRSEYITVRSLLEKKEQQSQVAVGIGELGLRESRVPPLKLEVTKDELKNTQTP